MVTDDAMDRATDRATDGAKWMLPELLTGEDGWDLMPPEKERSLHSSFLCGVVERLKEDALLPCGELSCWSICCCWRWKRAAVECPYTDASYDVDDKGSATNAATAKNKTIYAGGLSKARARRIAQE